MLENSSLRLKIGLVEQTMATPNGQWIDPSHILAEDCVHGDNLV
jgi:hypothetical protein